jgi:putative ABC transport system permease protein
MIRLAFKNIWARKKRLGWLLAELVVVCIILWRLLDPLIVQTYVTSLPDGFEVENLYRISILEYEPSASCYRKEAADDKVRTENIWRIRERVCHYAGIESATFQVGFSGPGGNAFILGGYPVADSVRAQYNVYFVPKSDYFTTFRYLSIGGPSLRQMDQMTLEGRKHIFTEYAFPDGPSWGRKYKDGFGNDHLIMASVLPVKIRISNPPEQVQFYPSDVKNVSAIIFRLRDDIDPDDFLPVFQEWANRELQLGNYFVNQIESYRDYMEQSTYLKKHDYQVQLLLTSFFLFCVFFGVSGTFWMQTRSRREEIGILKSFGATSGRMICLFLLEGLILATVAVVLGAVIYLQYALHAGLYMPEIDVCSPYVHYWFESFKEHFLIVSGVVWLLMMLIVSFGIYVPMRGISRIAPTEALHEE